MKALGLFLGVSGLMGVGGFGIRSCSMESDRRSEARYEASREPIIGGLVRKRYEPSVLLECPEFEGGVRLEDSRAILTIRKNGGGLIGLSVIDNADGQKEALLEMIVSEEESPTGDGSIVSFPKGSFNCDYSGNIVEDPLQTEFYEDTQTGVKRAGLIKILERGTSN